MKTNKILIIGAGNAGISVAAQLLRRQPELQIDILDPSERHYYQPAYTLVGAGVYDAAKTVRPQQSVIPRGARWHHDEAVRFDPKSNSVSTASGKTHTYDVLVVATGVVTDYDSIDGLRDTLGHNGVTTNYALDYAPYTWQLIRDFEGGTAVFTNPPSPIKCGGAPHKIMYLACDYWRKKGILDRCDVHYVSGGTKLFGIEAYAVTLEEKIKQYNIKTHFRCTVDRIDGQGRKLYFKRKTADGTFEAGEMNFDLCHVVPAQTAPASIAQSPLADPQGAYGFVAVDKHTLQHPLFPNVFGVGDVISAPASKTGAAVRKQAPVVTDHILAYLQGTTSTARYDGYSACPIPTAYGRLMLAEFDYSGQPAMTFPFDQAKPRWSMWILKRYILPWLYWNRILKGKV